MRFLVRRQWGAVTEDEMVRNGLRSVQVADEMSDVVWDHSHVVADEEGRVVSYCVYDADSAEHVMEHAGRTGGHFVDLLIAVDDDLGPGGDDTSAGGGEHRWMVVERWSDHDRGRVADALAAPTADDGDIAWEHTHLGDDDGRVMTHGVYGAADETMIRRHVDGRAELVELYEIGGDVRRSDLVG